MGIKLKLTLDQQALNLIELAEEVYNHHFGPPRNDQITNVPDGEMDAAVFGFVYAQTLTDKADVREVAYHALQIRFGWDDEYIATMVIGG